MKNLLDWDFDEIYQKHLSSNERVISKSLIEQIVIVYITIKNQYDWIIRHIKLTEIYIFNGV